MSWGGWVGRVGRVMKRGWGKVGFAGVVWGGVCGVEGGGGGSGTGKASLCVSMEGGGN